MLIHNADITGSLLVNGTGYNTGSFSGSFTGAVAGTTATASYVEYNSVANKPALVSGSSQVTYSGLTGIPSGIVSGSSQVTYSGLTGIPNDIVSGSSQVTYSGLTGIPSGIVSGSSQVTYSGLTGIPSGIVSGSAQISDFGIFATTGSNQFNGNQSITGSLTTTGTIVAQTLNVQQVTSSIVYSSGSNIFGNSVSNTQQFTGSVSITGSLTTSIAAFGSAASLYLVSDGGVIKSRTAAQTLSDIAALPLAGGTLTGALRVENNAITQDGTRPILTLQQSGNTKVFLGISSGSSDLVLGDASGDAVFRKPASSGAFRFSVDGGTSSALVLASTGAATFSSSVGVGGQITGPSSAVTEGKFNFIGYNNAYGGITANTGFNTNYNAVSIYSNFNSTRNGQGNTSNPSWILDLGGSIPDPDSFGIFRSPAGSFSFSNLFKLSSTGAATFSSSVTAKSNITVSNNGAEGAILSAVSAFADGYRATLRLWNQHTGGKAWEVYSTNDADGLYGGGKLAFVNSTNSVNALVLTSTGAATFSSSVTAGSDNSTPTLTIGAASTNSIGWLKLIPSSTQINWAITSNYTSNLLSLHASTTLGGTTFSSPAVTIANSGNIITNGSIRFNGDTAEANALDDYEEGTWTPVPTSTGATFNTVVNGTYTKIGRLVYIRCQLDNSSAPTGTLTNEMSITNLPFTAAAGAGYGASLAIGFEVNIDYPAGGLGIQARVTANTTNISLRFTKDDASGDDFLASNFDNLDARIALSGCYEV